MKKDLPLILGAVVVGALAVWFLTKPKDAETKSMEAEIEDDNAVTIPPSPSPSNQSITPTYVVQTNPNLNTQANNQVQTPPPPQPKPYDLVEINPQLQSSGAYADLFGDCQFPIVANTQSVCVKRLQDALDVPKTGSFDDVTQFALDKYIEKLPNRADGHFGRFTRDGCIAFDPATAKTTNVCGLNHDQYLDILFKMGIPLTETYDA